MPFRLQVIYPESRTYTLWYSNFHISGKFQIIFAYKHSISFSLLNLFKEGKGIHHLPNLLTFMDN